MPANPDQLLTDEALNPDEFLTSLNGRYRFVYQGDGNLVLYRNQDGKALYHSNTSGTPAGHCTMQGDGNLVIYDPGGGSIWGSATDGHPGSRLVVQDDGNVVIYQPDNTPIWATNTKQAIPTGPTAHGVGMQSGEILNPGDSINSLNGSYHFDYQADGNLVLYRNQDGTALWASGTSGPAVGVCIMQGDGNLVLYGLDKEPLGIPPFVTGTTANPIWASGTDGHPGSRLVVQDDGNVVIKQPDDTQIWATNTPQSGWFRCRVVGTGPAEDGKIYLKLRDHSGGFDLWFNATDLYKKEMLATALTAMSIGLPVDAHLDSTVEYSTVTHLYLVRF